MKTISFQSHYSGTTLAKAIRLFSGGNFSHTSIKLETHVYEAHIKSGVTKTANDKYNYDDVIVTVSFEIEDARYEEVKKFLDAQVGKRYDTLGILAFLWFFIEQKPGKWFCSELGMVALMKAFSIPSMEYDQKQSPTSFYRLTCMVKRLSKEGLQTVYA